MKSFLVVENKIFSKLTMFSDQISVNRTETVHGTLRFLFLLPPILWNMCENLHYESYISRATQRPRILLTDDIQSREDCSVNCY